MDSVLLWKQEPVSPLSNDEASLFPDETSETFYQTALDNDECDIKFETDPDQLCESKAEIASQILDNLESLMDLDDLIKEGKAIVPI